MSFWTQTSAVYLVYFWMPISFGIDRGRMMTRHMMKRANRWSVYQWYGISPSLEPVTISYKEIHTGEELKWTLFICCNMKASVGERHRTRRTESYEVIEICKRLIYLLHLAKQHDLSNENIPVNVFKAFHPWGYLTKCSICRFSAGRGVFVNPIKCSV